MTRRTTLVETSGLDTHVFSHPAQGSCGAGETREPIGHPLIGVQLFSEQSSSYRFAHRGGSRLLKGDLFNSRQDHVWVVEISGRRAELIGSEKAAWYKLE